jgi:hypothetical protein
MSRHLTAAMVGRLVNACAGLDLDASPREYSGRGMYGQRCFGMVIPADGSLLRVGAAIGALAHEDEDDDQEDDDTADASAVIVRSRFDWEVVDELLRGPKVDNMAHDLIVYWPRLTADLPNDAGR